MERDLSRKWKSLFWLYLSGKAPDNRDKKKHNIIDFLFYYRTVPYFALEKFQV